MEEAKYLDQPSNENSSLTDGACSSFENDHEDLVDGNELLDRLDSEELTQLRKCFYEKIVDEKIKEPKGSIHPRFGGSKLTREEFIEAIASVLGSNAYDECADKLFSHIAEKNAEEHKGFIWWEQILDSVIDWMTKQIRERPSNVIKESFCNLCILTYCKRETIVRVVPVETPSSFCYVMVSKYGRVGIYDWGMSLLEQYEIKLGAQVPTQAGEVRRTTWVTDAVYLPDATMLLVSASDRSLHVFSTTGLVHVPTYHISGLPNTPTCLHYTIGATTEDPSMLLVGDDHGSITTIQFHQPQYSLFKRTSSDRMDTYFWKELENQADWVTISTEHGVHKDEVLKVEYFSDNHSVVSCSSDPNTTLIIRYLAGRRAPYIFRISRGVRCFHLDRSLKLLVTGSKDSIIRMWNPVLTKKPLASLFGHKTCVVDVRILKHLGVILSMSKDAAVKVWDLQDQTCVQSLPTLFPVVGALARTAEFGAQTFYPGPVSCQPPSTSVQNKHQPKPTPQQTHPASLLSSTSTTRQDRASAFKNEGEWNRMELLAVCCNYVVVLQLSGRELGAGDPPRVGEALPPPLREQDPAVPSPWLTGQVSMLNVDYPSQLSSSSREGSPIPPSVLETIQKSLGDEMTYQFKALTSSCHNLNAAKAKQYTNQKHVRAMVEQCAPHMALNLCPLEEIKFSHPLPTTARLRNLDLSNPDKLLKAKLKRDSTSTVGSKASNTSTSSTLRSNRNK
ncbi:uncharacterized protein LOC124362399 isoform X2 [Homalodisca vitripennis]|uniref:uncharacterized protein LOC124362399 isoform X2 n=1 Tax=Homalodisca vitripennis TaxID=197043 RepID=UPI001EEBC7FE|nr:uncharacterized protein LOC124362399 isoform X2 [Homalodisca vitripennis]